MPITSILSFSIPTRTLHLFTLSLFVAAAAFADEECKSRLSYWGYFGPEQWKNLPIPDNECGGERQSPINLPRLTGSRGPVITVEYTAGDATIRNTGHDIEVTPAGNAGGIKIGDKAYTLVKFHFHVPSEHHIVRNDTPAEMHVVHRLNGGTDYAVIGVMLTRGGTYPALEPVFANFPTNVCDKFDKVRIDFTKLLTGKLSYYTYAGSLTTPPCKQNVTWYVLDAPRTIPSSDLAKLCDLGVNARPIQNNSSPITYVSDPQ